MKASSQIIIVLFLFSMMMLGFPSAYGAAICNSASSTNATGTLTDSGGSSGNYSNNENCDFLIQPTGASTITISFAAFSLENTYDFLTVYDGPTSASPVLANNLTGNNLPASVTSTGSTMLVRFSSDFSVNQSGFVANWVSTVASSCPTESVSDSFSNVSYNQNSGSENWVGNWTEVGESDGTNAGIARIRGDLCTSGNCLRLGVPSGSSAQTFSNRGVFREIDLSSVSSATLSFVYRRARSQGSETVVLSVSNNGGSSWTNLQTYSINSHSPSPITATFDISAYSASNTQIRFLASGSNAVIGMYIDDISISYQPVCTPLLIAEYRFDEIQYDDVENEVIDSFGTFHGRAKNVQPVKGKVCNAIDLSASGTSDYVILDENVLTNKNDFSVSLWANTSKKTAQSLLSGSSAGSNNDLIMWFTRDTSFRPYLKNSQNGAIDVTSIADEKWHHLVWTRSGSQSCLYIDTLFQGCVTQSISSLNIESLIVGQEQDSVGGRFESSQAFNGLIDELLVFDGPLSATDISTLYDKQNAGLDDDGNLRNCPVPAVPLLEYRFEEGSWNGTPGEIIDSTGNNYNGQLVRNSTPATALSALSGDPGTCSYASQNNGSIQVTGLPLDTTTDGVKTTVTFWMNWDGTNSTIPLGWNVHSIWITGSSIGFNTGAGDLYGTSNAGLANGWHHIAVEFTNGSVVNNRMHIDGIEQTLTQRQGSPNNSRAVVYNELSIGGWSINNNYDFYGLVDEVRVYQSVLTTSQVVNIMNERHPCNTPVIHHYEIVHDGQGLTCEAETLTIKACTDESCSNVNLSTESVTLDLLADGSLISSKTFIGSTTVSFNHTDVETLSLSVANTSITASDPLVCDASSSNSCDIAFTNAGFRFLYGTENSTFLPNQIAGSLFSDTLKLQAVKDINGVCTGVFTGNNNVDLSQENINPGGTSGLSFSVNGNNIAKHSNVTNTPLNFGGNSMATLPTPVYHDAGKIRLHANYDVGGVTLSGSSHAFWVSPAELVVAAKSGETKLNGATATAAKTYKAGENFTLTVTAYNAATPSVITPNYSPEQIQFMLERTGPTLIDTSVDGKLSYAAASDLVTSTSPIFKNVTLANFSSGVSIYNAAQYSEVGLLNLDVQDSNYGNEGIIVPATDINIGRFIPDHFEQTVADHGVLFSTCNVGTTFAFSGQKDEATETIGAISYLTSPVLAITAYNKQGNITQNYYEDSEGSVNDYMKLSGSDIVITAPVEDKVAVGVNGNLLRLTANMHTGTLSENDLTALIANPLPKGVLHYQFSDEFNLSDKDNFFYNRSDNAKVTPFTSNFDFATTTIMDTDNVSLTTTVDASPTGVEIRFGRLRLENNFGPETENLPQPMYIEHFDDTAFVITPNSDCVSYDTSKVSLTNISLDPTLTNTLGGIGNFVNGKTKGIELEAPGAKNQGAIGVSYDAYDWLKYDWNNTDGSHDGPYDDNPSAAASFGVFRSNDRIIQWREVFNK